MKLSVSTKVEGVKCKVFPVYGIIENEKYIIPDMLRLMKVKHGGGLAAPQVGIKRTFFIMLYGGHYISCYNPLWTPKNPKKAISKEGCLTYPPTRLNQKSILRYKLINTEFINSENVPEKVKMRGIDAIIFQHECDHLVGKTIYFDPEGK